MFVQAVVPGSGAPSWAVFGDDDVLIDLADRLLAYLTE
jgi:hypothetical protein